MNEKRGMELRLAVMKELKKLGLDRAKRVMVRNCNECPCMGWRVSMISGEHLPTCQADKDFEMCSVKKKEGEAREEVRVPESPEEPPPHNCPLRAAPLSLAIHPEV